MSQFPEHATSTSDGTMAVWRHRLISVRPIPRPLDAECLSGTRMLSDGCRARASTSVSSPPRLSQNPADDARPTCRGRSTVRGMRSSRSGEEEIVAGRRYDAVGGRYPKRYRVLRRGLSWQPTRNRASAATGGSKPWTAWVSRLERDRPGCCPENKRGARVGAQVFPDVERCRFEVVSARPASVLGRTRSVIDSYLRTTQWTRIDPENLRTARVTIKVRVWPWRGGETWCNWAL